MFVKLAVIVCSVAAATAVWNGPLAGGVPASQFPAGISPQACPNYPHCANPSVAATPNAPAPAVPYGGYAGAPYGGQYGGAPAYNGPYNAPAVPQYGGYGQSALDRGEYTGDGDYHGEGLAESGAYGDVSQNYNSGGYNGGYQGGYNGGYNQGAYNPAQPPAGLGQTPAGVDPHSCPNYPFCH